MSHPALGGWGGVMIIWGGGYVHGSEVELLDGNTRVWGTWSGHTSKECECVCPFLSWHGCQQKILSDLKPAEGVKRMFGEPFSDLHQ